VISVSSEHRLKRLRDLLGQLQRLPVSAERERMIREVRARIVDVDTGVPPSALLQVFPDSTPAPAPRSRTTRAPSTVAPKPAAKPVHVSPAKDVAPFCAEVAADGSSTAADDRLSLAAGELLSLDDSWFAPIEPQAEPAAAPWRYGLRG
jgi:hypothetical protein